MSYATPNLFSKILSIPISLAQTELRRSKNMQIMQFELKLDQVLELRSLNLHVIKIMTPGIVPIYSNTSLGLASVGVYQASMLTGGMAIVKGMQVGVTQMNPWTVRRFASPGVYNVIVSNNTTNVDISVSAMGALKLYIA